MPSRSNRPTHGRPVELTGTNAGAAPDVVAEDVIRVVKLWERVFGLDPVKLVDAVLVLRRLANKGDEDAFRLGETLARVTGRAKWNSRAVALWLTRASKYRVSGRWIRASRLGWLLEVPEWKSPKQ